jgi:PhnB protein
MTPTPVAAYLNFDGDCRDAMTFYQQCLGGELEVMTFGDSQFEGQFEASPGAEGRILHAYLSDGTFSLMASDTMPGMRYQAGNQVSLLVVCDSDAQVDERFDALSAGGQTTMPPDEAFWGAYFAVVVDRFGVGWMLSHERPVAAQTEVLADSAAGEKIG